MRWKEFHYIRRSDRRVLWFLLAILVVVLAVMIFGGTGDELFTEAGLADSTSTPGFREGNGRYSGYRDNSGYKNYENYRDRQGGYYAVRPRSVRRFPFDPNTADSTDLLSLGLQPWQVRSIYKYRAAGGVYRRKEDFARLYGLTDKQYRELEPYIRIGKGYQPYVVINEPRPRHVNVPESIAAHSQTPVKLKAGQKIELNGADTAQLMRVPGIGRYYARQIVNRRTWLGGFYTVDQLVEIEYLPKEAINYFYVNTGAVRKINLNKASISDMKRHPYINYYQAKDIVDFRRLRGPIKSIEDLRLMKDFTDKDIEKIKHYVEY